jgi:hypothetical protein
MECKFVDKKQRFSVQRLYKKVKKIVFDLEERTARNQEFIHKTNRKVRVF